MCIDVNRQGQTTLCTIFDTKVSLWRLSLDCGTLSKIGKRKDINKTEIGVTDNISSMTEGVTNQEDVREVPPVHQYNT